MLQSAFGLLDSHTGWTGWEATAHGPADAVTIPDAHLLFSGDFKRAGTDLILSDDTQKFIVHDYFRGEQRPTLLSPDGARLTADAVEALTGPGPYAQAAGVAQTAAAAVGRVAKVEGSATLLRNGVAITVNSGDAVLKGDVLQTGAGTLAVTFADGSTLNLTANSRLVVNDFVYDPKGSANSEILNLVQGSLTFISGEVAHSGGDMKITTPVATMGIRGTVGGVTEANDGAVSFYVVQSQTGAVITDNAGRVLFQVVQDGPLIQVRPAGPLQVIAEEVHKSTQELAAEQAALQSIVNTQAIGLQIMQHFFDLQNSQNPQSLGTNHTQIEIDIPRSAILGGGTQGGNTGNQGSGNTASVTTTITDHNGNTTIIHDQVPVQPNPPPANSGSTVYWTGGGTPGDSSDPTNWSPGAPTHNDNAVIGRDADNNPVPDQAVTASGPFDTHSLTLSDGAQLHADDVTVGGLLAVLGNDPSNTTEIVGGLTIHNVGGDLFLHATTGDAEIRSTDDLIIGNITGDLTVEAVAGGCASAHAEILACGPDLTIGNIHGNFLLSASITDSGNAVARIASDNVTIGDVTHDFTVTGGADSCAATFAEISASSGDLIIGNIGGNLLNAGLLDADNGTLSIGTVGGSFVNDGDLRAYELQIAANDGSVLDNHGKIIVNSGFLIDDDDTSAIGVDVHNSGLIKVTDTLLTFDGHVQNLDCGVILASQGSEIDFNGGVSNSALIKASHDGEIDFNSHVFNSGTIEAAHCGTIDFNCGGVDNCGLIEARHDGGIAFYDSVFNSDTITASHGGEIDFHASVHNSGTIEAASCGSISFETNCVDNCGTISVDSGGQINFDHWVGGNGTLALDGGTIELASGTCNTIDFSGTCGGNLVLDCATAGVGQITGFGPDDSIDLYHLNDVSIVGYTADSCNTGSLELYSCATGDFYLSFTGDGTNYTADNFVLSCDGNGGTQLTEAPAIDVLNQQVNTDHDTNVTTVTDFKIVEPFAGDDPLTITAVAHNGATLAFGDTTPSDTISETATLDEINAVLHNGVVYTPSSSPPENDNVGLTIADDHGNSESLNLIFKVAQTEGGATLTATSGNDVMYGSESCDTFVFDNTQNGHDVVAHFDSSHDVLQFDSTIFDTICDVLDSAHDDIHGNAVITTAHNGTITLDHVAAAALNASNIAINGVPI